MFDKERYLELIGFSGTPDASLATLRELHRKHQLTLYYDNGYVQTTNFLDFDLDALFETIVVGRRGGICTDLNFLFDRLLRELGFEVKLLAAGILLPSGKWGPDVEHAVMVVTLDGEDWLVDVGNGGVCILDPLPFSAEPAVQEGIGFRLIQEGEYHILQYRTRNKDWRIAYRFTMRVHEMSAWGRLSELNTIHQDVLVRRRRRVTDRGQIMLTANYVVTIEDGVERPSLVRDPAELEKLVAEHWG
ncbi:arylamine N-acetyltransferase [Streptomyces sp. NPDC057623]|uniref:arylamine N-acetyltransferase family protein n=1 Tax=Streptomyces sp. NPDC057623 TaxID=3346187 RepID=UPI00369ACEB4